MNKITLVQILRSPEGGIRKHVVDILENLSGHKYKKIFITDLSSSDRDLTYLQEKYGVVFCDLRITDQPSFRDFFNIIKIVLFLRKEKNMILHGHGAKGGLYARLCSLLLCCFSVYTPHGGSLHRVFGKVKGFIFDTVEKLLMPLTDKFIFESQYSASAFHKHIGKRDEKSVVNYNGVSFSNPCKDQQYESGQKLQLASFGLLRKLKGHDIIIDALAIAKKENVNFSYTIYGYGEEHSSLMDRIRKFGLIENIAIRDFTDQILEEMKLYDVIIHPSRFESFGYVPLEAMSVKVPVITSYEGGLKEVFVDGGTLLAKGNDPVEYAHIIKKIFQGQSDLVGLTERAYQESKKKFSIDVMISNLDAVYHSLWFSQGKK